jgi:lysophospholipase L1-like esterase
VTDETGRRRLYDSMGQPSHLDRALRVVALLLVIVIVVLGATEVLMRAIFDAPIKPYTPNSLYHASRTPNFTANKVCVEDGTRFDYTIDPLGFRGKSMTETKKPAGRYRVFFVGASTTENQHLPEEKTFPGLVEEKLRARGVNAEVANCGIAGQGIARSLALIIHRILELEPDLIVLLEGENDLVQSFDERWDPTHPPVYIEKLTFKDWLMTKSRLVAVLDAPGEVDMRPFLEKRRKEAEKNPYNVPAGLDVRRGLAPFEKYLRRVAVVCDDAKVPLVLMTQPTLWKEENSPEEKAAMWMSNVPPHGPHVDPKTCAALMSEYNDAARRAAQGHVLVDLDRIVPHDLKHLYDDAHLNVRANALVADAVVAAVSSSGLLPAR